MSVMTEAEVTCVWPAGRLLGEGPWWSVQEAALYWVDIKRPAILRFRPSDGDCIEWPCPEVIGSCVPRRDGGHIVALRSGVYAAELGAPGEPIHLGQRYVLPGLQEGDRCNDGKCHPDGSFWVGTMDNAEEAARGWFYRLSPGGQVARVGGPYAVCNGPAFSPDGRIAYLTDSATRRVYRYVQNTAAPAIELFLQFDASDGFPDGMTTDADGCLWIAMWDGAKVVRVAPGGQRLAEIALPVSRPTSCAFGGAELDKLYVTSASIGLDAARLEQETLAGGLFQIMPDGVRGCPTATFAG